MQTPLSRSLGRGALRTQKPKALIAQEVWPEVSAWSCSHLSKPHKPNARSFHPKLPSQGCRALREWLFPKVVASEGFGDTETRVQGPPLPTVLKGPGEFLSPVAHKGDLVTALGTQVKVSDPAACPAACVCVSGAVARFWGLTQAWNNRL